MMLAMRAWQAYEASPVKPPVSFGLTALLIAAHVYPAMVLPYSLDAICISSRALLLDVARGYWPSVARRVVLSTIAHADDMHLYYNVTSLLVKGVSMEAKFGSETLAWFVVYATLMSALLSVAAGAALESLGLSAGCAVGFSGILFAMKVVLNHTTHAPDSTERSSVWGVRVAARHAHWLEIVVSSYVNPRSSFVVHAAGAAAGLLWVEKPRITALLLATTATKRAPRPRYTYSAGTANTPPPACASPDDAHRTPPAPATAETLRRRRVERFGT